MATNYLTPRDVASVLGVSAQAVRLWCRTGVLPADRGPGTRTWRIDPDDFELWAHRQPVADVKRSMHAPYRSKLSDDKLVAEALDIDRSAVSPRR